MPSATARASQSQRLLGAAAAGPLPLIALGLVQNSYSWWAAAARGSPAAAAVRRCSRWHPAQRAAQQQQQTPIASLGASLLISASCAFIWHPVQALPFEGMSRPLAAGEDPLVPSTGMRSLNKK